MQHVLKVPKVKLSIVINVFFPAAAVVVQSRLTFQSSTQQLGLARSENTHYVAARAESLCLICQSFQLFGDVTHFNGPMSLILHLAKVFLPPTPVQIKASPCPSCHPHEAGSGSAAQAANTFSQCWCCCCPEGKGGGMARADRSPGSWEGLTSPHLPGRGAKGCRAGDTGGAAPQCGAGRGFHTQPGPTAGTQDGWLWEKQLQLQGILCCTLGLNTTGNLCLAPNTELVSVPVQSSPSPGTQAALLPTRPRAVYLADHLQHVPGGVSRPDDCQGRLVVGQAEPRGCEVLVHPNVTVGVVLVDTAQGHFLLPLNTQNPS